MKLRSAVRKVPQNDTCPRRARSLFGSTEVWHHGVVAYVLDIRLEFQGQKTVSADIAYGLPLPVG